MSRRLCIAVSICIAWGVGAAASAQTLASDRAWLNPMNAIEKARLKDFVEEPLFDPTRRLPPPPPPAYVPPPPPPVAAAPAPVPSVHLLGVIQGSDEIADVAVIRTADDKTVVLHTGDHLGAWLVEVRPIGLRVSNGDQVFDFGLFAKPGTQPGPLPVDPAIAGIAAPVYVPPALAARNARLGKRTY